MSISKDEDPPVYILMEQGTVKELILNVLDPLYESLSGIQSEALWILINVIAKVDHNGLEIIRSYKLPEILVRLFKKKELRISENVALLKYLANLVFFKLYTN